MEEKLNFLKEKRVLVISISAFVILLSVFIYLIITQLNSLEANASQEQKSKYYTIKQSEPISIEGTIYPKEEQNVSKDLLIGQNETEILVEEGAKVKKDHVLLKITDTEIQAQVKMNHSKIANLNKDINQKESQINSIKSEINSLETDTQNISRKVEFSIPGNRNPFNASAKSNDDYQGKKYNRSSNNGCSTVRRAKSDCS